MHISKLYPSLNKDIIIRGLSNNSKTISKNYIFYAIKGGNHNGEDFIDEAIENGAIIIISKHKPKNENIIWIKSNNPKNNYIKDLQCFYHYNTHIYTVGITGTDGKTTTSYYLKSIFDILEASGVIGTNGVAFLNHKYPSINTTPDAKLLYSYYNLMDYNNVLKLVVEASSEGIKDSRLKNFNFCGCIASNLSHEHLNSHKSMDSYFLCKMRLISTLNEKSLLIYNSDDKYMKYAKYYTKGKYASFGEYSGDYRLTNYLLNLDGSIFDVNYKNSYLGTFKTNLFGKYNILNALSAIAYAYEIGIPLPIIKKGIAALNYVDGRFMKYQKNGITAIIDFAHTPNALKCLLEDIKRFAKGKIILVIGAQGQKDKTKRPIMGSISVKYADIVIFTSEDPKNENITDILYDLTKKIKNKDYYISLNRKDAIKLAKALANKNDIILITGKGNEKYEKIGDIKYSHNDYNIIKEALNS